MFPEFSFYLDCITRLIYVVTDEEDRFLTQLRDGLRRDNRVANARVYNAAFGLIPLLDLIEDWTKKEHKIDKDTLNIQDALTAIYKDEASPQRKYYVITDPDRWLQDQHVQRRILNILHQVHNDSGTAKILICVGSRRYIPEKLARYTEVVHDTGFTADEILKLVCETCAELEVPAPDHPEEMFRGLTSFEVQSALIQGYKRDKLQDDKELARYKFRQLRKTDLVQYVDTSKNSFAEVGGAGRFKKWAEMTKAAWTPEGRAFGLEPPKGVLAVGIWGTGKSLTIKALGSAWGLPVIQLELGKLRTSELGGTEGNMYRALRIVESMSPCVTGETLVTLADGSQRPILELWEDVDANLCDLEVMCWDERRLRVATTSVKVITRRVSEALRIEASHGFYLQATPNHQHYVLRGGMPEWVRTDELNPGDMLAVPLAVHSGNNDLTRFHPQGMRQHTRGDGAMEFRRGGGGYRDAVVSRLPAEWSPQLGWLLGVIEGDGYISRGSDSIGLTNTDSRLLDRFETILADKFGVTCRRHLAEPKALPNLPGLSPGSEFKPCWHSVVANQLVAETLRKARAEILNAPPAVRSAFLAGWIDADGCIGSQRVTLTVKHPMMWHQRCTLGRQLIQSLGIVPSKFDMPNMEITGSRAVQLSRIVGEYLVSKGAKASVVTSSEIGFDRDSGFACGQVVQSLRKTSGVKFSELPVPASTCWNHENGRSLVSERHLEQYVDAFGKGTDLERLFCAECRWVTIKEIVGIGEQPVYDLVCEGEDTHSFFANGLVTHNCLVWVDEAEKSLAGSHSSSHTDAGTTSRSIGIFSTWLQETKLPVCLAMTANSLKTLPVEFVNRMDDRWFFDLPSIEDRIDILKIHIAKRGQDYKRFDLAALAEKAKLMVGREIEQAIKSALTASFHAKKRALDEGILFSELERKPRIVKTMVAEINETLDWIGFDPDVDDGIRAKFAADPAGRDRKFSVS
jgi:AAA+ superfamily predicted ATPase